MTRYRQRNRGGYTLVELMIAILLTGLLLTITWVMFASSSDILGEVDSKAAAGDRLRFAMERLRTDVQAAGSLATVDNLQDPWVQPKDNTWRMTGIYPYSTWQDNAPAAISGANPFVRFDGFVVMGAYDNPLSFEIGNFSSDLDEALIPANARGLHKIHVPDPFRTATGAYPVDFDTADDISQIKVGWDSRIMRIQDAGGFMHFVKIKETIDSSSLTQTPGGTKAVKVAFDTGDHAPLDKTATVGPYGLDVSAEADRAYDAALIDAYWYHVREDPNDSTNYQLVRERLCAPSVANATSGTGLTTWVPSEHTPSESADCPSNQDELIVISDAVADFQVWFDCAANYQQPVTDASWKSNWLIPIDTDNCMKPSVEKPELARVAHIRLSLRGENERSDLQHYMFEDALGNTCESGTCDVTTTFAGARLQTYDIVPELEGAAPVVTLQTEVFLPNYVIR